MKAILNIIDWCKKHIIIFIAMIAVILFAWVSYSRTVSFPIEYLQKIPFGILGSAIIIWCAFQWVKFGLPKSYDKLDDETPGGVNALNSWERVKVSLFWISLFSIIAAILAFAL